MSQARLMRIMSPQYSRVRTKVAQDPYSDVSYANGSQTEEDNESLLEKTYTANQRSGSRRQHILFVVILIPALLVAFLCGTFAASQLGPVNKDQLCAKHTNSYSPVVKDVAIEYTNIQFNGSLFYANEFRQDAGPEVDAAWEALGVNYRPLRVSTSEAASSGLSRHVQISPKYGGGHPANVEGLHQLHCLNLLRKTMWYNFEYYHKLGQGPFSNEDYVLKAHATHCLDIVRQQLMCVVDTGVLGQVWIDPRAPEPFVDFNTQHRCKNYDAVRAWAEERQLPAETPDDFLLPPSKGDLLLQEIP